VRRGSSATLEREGLMIKSLDTRIAAHALALGLMRIRNHRALRTIKGLKIEDSTKSGTGRRPARCQR
jgi:hypothetical protein